MNHQDTPISQDIILKWQQLVDLITDIVGIPAALIMRVGASEIEVFVAGQSKENPYIQGEKAPIKSGLYCETVMDTRSPLLVPNALDDEKWNANPDIELGMISYYGLPLIWPNGDVFGTICVLDRKTNAYSENSRRLLQQFQDSIESDLRTLSDFNRQLLDMQQAQAEIEREVLKRTQAEEELRRREAMLRSLIMATSGEDQTYFERLALSLWDTLGADYILIGESIESDSVRTIVFCDRGRIVDNFSYTLAGTPCANVLQTGVCMYPEGIAELFPKDLMLQDIQAQGYAGTPLVNHSGETIGIIAVLYTSPVAERDFIASVFEVFAMHAGYAIERRRMEDALYEANAGLEERVAARTEELYSSNEQLRREIEVRECTERELRQAKEDAEAANRYKDEFLANMSHELRTPLNGVLGYAQLLEGQDTLTEQQRKFLDVIYRSGQHLLTFISDIFELTKIEAGHLSLEISDFDLTRSLKTVVEMVQIETERKGLTFEYRRSPGLPRITYGDERRLRQILLHVLGNAVKFTTHGTVSLRVTNCEPAAGVSDAGAPQTVACIRFEVEDTGSGIPPEELATIFQSFQQGKLQRSFTNGAGVGLSISQRLVQGLNSELQVRSTVDRGSLFWFDVEFETKPSLGCYETPEEILRSRGVEAPPLVLPPAEKMSEFYTLTLLGDILELRTRIQEFDDLYPGYQVFTDKLRTFATNMNLAAMQSFLQQHFPAVASKETESDL